MQYPVIRTLLTRGIPTAALLLTAAMCHGQKKPVVSVSVAGFIGTDKTLAETVSGTVLAYLARSAKVSVVEGGGPASSTARFRISGICHSLDSHILVNVRVVDLLTGRAVPGGADNVLGSNEQMPALLDELAGRLAESIGETASAPLPSRAAAASRQPLRSALNLR